jgi:hypothetical protein
MRAADDAALSITDWPSTALPGGRASMNVACGWSTRTYDHDGHGRFGGLLVFDGNMGASLRSRPP